MNTKNDLKAAREALGHKKFDEAVKACKRVLLWEGENYNAWVFLAVAYTGLEDDQEAESAYKRALEINSDSMLAWQGLISFYEKRSRWAELERTIQHLLPRTIESGDGNRLADYLKKQLDIYENKIPNEEKFVDTLKKFLPDSPVYDLLKAASSVPSAVEIWTKLIRITETNEKRQIEKEVHSRRFRVNAGSLSEVQEEVEAEVYGKSNLGHMYEQLLGLGESSPELKVKLLHFYRRRLPGVTEKKELYEKMMQLATTLVQEHIDDILPYELMIETTDTDDVASYDQSLLDYIKQHFPSSGLAKISSGYDAFQRNEMDEAFDLFGEGLDASPDSPFAYQCLSWIYHDSQEYESGLEYATRGRDLVRKLSQELGITLDKVLLSMELCMAHCYRQLDVRYYSDAMAIYKKVLSRAPDQIGALEGIGVILVADKKYDEALSYFEKVHGINPARHMTLAEIGWIYCEKGSFEQAIEYITKAIEVAGKNTAEYSYRLGRVYWAMGETHQAEAFKYFLQAVKIDSQFANGFSYLGHYYRIVQKDAVRAKKCYQKAFVLNPMDVEAALHLSDYYVLDGESANAETVFRQITELCPKVGWAWRRLGYANMENNVYNDAITCFQKALRTDTNDVRCWEGLAEAYSHEGRYVAALKAFGRATDLDPSSVHARHEKALVKQKVGMLDEAIAEFQATLEIAAEQGKANYMPSIKGLADTYLERAKEDFQQGFFGRVAAGCGNVIGTVLRGLQKDPTLLSLWKLVADACIMYRQVPSYLYLCAYRELQEVMQIMGDKNPHTQLGLPHDATSQLMDEFMPLDVSDPDFDLPAKAALDVIFACASFAYKQALVLSKNHGSVAPAFWHDLALVYHWMSENNNSESTDETNPLMETAMKCVHMALKLNPTQHHYWNTLGVIAMQQAPKISQYALVKAMEYNNRSAVPWTNYGFLCLLRKDYELANQAFETAHALDPEWISAWTGQAYVASLWGTDAAAIFQHAFEASNGSSLDASYGYADTVFTALSASSQTDSYTLIAPAFALQKLTEQKLNDAVSLNLLGLLLERLRQYGRASEAFASAILALEAKAEQDQVTQEELGHRLAKVHANLGRTLCASGDFSGAIASYEHALSSAAFETGPGRVYCQLGSGIAYYFEDRLEESLSMFEAALNETEADIDLRQDVVVLLSKVLWALGGDEQRSVAKDQLFSVISDNPNYLPAIFSLCVMGILGDDGTLTQAALQELCNVSPDIAYTSDRQQWVPWLISRFHKLQNEPTRSMRTLVNSIHQLPWLAVSWARLSADMDVCGDQGVKKSMTSAALAVVVDKATTANEKAHVYECASKACNDRSEESLKDAQRAIRLAPWRLTAWQALANATSLA
ncbi:uncharacterized protein BYT42DRAFT_568792 [Radiomyces spectabilis]|uniref:uncharacterized protein n=1 Tax=Radiomyces spectabilis TaxID=64574 RepID=UPI00222056E7|nr:uncharacterized protein BYT42DRAFT_568792 [Radiomyces spectabilis]KAI8379442.1 hypothetical protein BYT42DRAFT_568792 [Radiomyces spectabilis]